MTIAVAPLTEPDLAYEIDRAVRCYDTPDIPFASFADFRAALDAPIPGHVTERYLAMIDGEPAGTLELCLPQLDNLENADVEIGVRPSCRRRGVGRALHERALARVRELGRKRIFGQTVANHPDGAAFASALGASAGLAETRSRLDLDTVEQDRLDDLLAGAWPHAAGYRLVQWIAAAPDDLVDDMAYLDSRLNLDAPMGDLDVGPEKVDADRIRAGEEMSRLRRRITIHSGAVHVASGRLVAWTKLAGAVAIAEHLWQNITIVDPGHRGHRLGLITKIENLRYARQHRPGLRAIDTFNASANEHMLAINRMMGFHPVDAWTQWQQTVA
jgi:GNAT superfamily N-acetyltransferase